MRGVRSKPTRNGVTATDWTAALWHEAGCEQRRSPAWEEITAVRCDCGDWDCVQDRRPAAFRERATGRVLTAPEDHDGLVWTWLDAVLTINPDATD